MAIKKSGRLNLRRLGSSRGVPVLEILQVSQGVTLMRGKPNQEGAAIGGQLEAPKWIPK